MTLLIAYGNPGRGDDGLGVAFATWAEDQRFKGLDVSVGFQLTVEHALMVSRAACVVFVDAALDFGPPSALEPLAPSKAHAVDSHHLHPATVLTLSRLLFDACPPAFLLSIRGHDFGIMHDQLSDEAERSLADAKTRFRAWFERAQAELNAQEPA